MMLYTACVRTDAHNDAARRRPTSPGREPARLCCSGTSGRRPALRTPSTAVTWCPSTTTAPRALALRGSGLSCAWPHSCPRFMPTSSAAHRTSRSAGAADAASNSRRNRTGTIHDGALCISIALFTASISLFTSQLTQSGLIIYLSGLIVMDPTWIPTIQHVHVSGDGVIHANVSWTDLSTAAAFKEVVPVAWLKSTLPSMTRNFAYDPQLALRHFPRLNREYGPYTYVWPKSAQATLIGSDPSVPVLPNGFLVPPV